MKEQSSVSCLLVNQQDKEWGTTVSTVGCQHIHPRTCCFPANSPQANSFSTETGRILDEYQIIYITGGQGTFQSSSCPPTRIGSGQMILLFPGEWHTYQPNPATGWYEHWIGFSGSVMDQLVAKGFFTPANPIFNVGLEEQIVNLYHQATALAQAGRSGYQQLLAGIVQLLLGYTFAEGRENVDEDSEARLMRAKQYVQEHYTDEITIADLAAMSEMSPSSFRQRFKEYTGLSPINYIKEVRLERSKELLVNTQLTSKEIAYSTGFNTPYYFSIVFKQSVGMSPLEFRSMSQRRI